jgi:PrgI family protein
MQFKVPQDVQRADRIVGPLTLRQLIICGIGFSIAYGIYTVLGRDYELITAIIPVIVIALVTIVFAFVKPINLTFEKYILFLIESFILPRKRYWIKGTGDPSRLSYTPPKSAKKKLGKSIKKSELKKEKSISELTDILDRKNK